MSLVSLTTSSCIVWVGSRQTIGFKQNRGGRSELRGNSCHCGGLTGSLGQSSLSKSKKYGAKKEVREEIEDKGRFLITDHKHQRTQEFGGQENGIRKEFTEVYGH